MLISSTYRRLAALLLTALLFTACGGETAAATEEAAEAAAVETEEAAPQQGPEYTSAYVCPMHCDGSGSAEPGKCPVCQMDYVANEDHPDHAGGDHDGHDHDDGHNH